MVADPANQELLRVLEEARSHYDDELERRLMHSIADSALVVPMQREPGAGELGIRVSVNADGSRHLLGFTSTQELTSWAQGVAIDHRVMPGRELAAFAKPADAVALWIDPASDHGGRLSRDRVDLVAADGSLELEYEQDGALVLRTGDAPIEVRPLGFVPSEPALEALREAAGADEGVREAWLLAGGGGGAADVVLVVVDEGDADPAPLARVLGQILPSGWSGDVYPVTAVEFAAGDYDAVRRGLHVYP
jgi:SseB protein N-terminal domain